MNNINKRRPNPTGDIPDFLVKTTLGCALIVILILIPFVINNLIQDRFPLALATGLVVVACAVNVWYGLRGKYSLLVNTYLVGPACAATTAYTMIRLGAAGSFWPFLLVLAYYFVLPEKRGLFFNVLTFMIIIPLAWYILEKPMAFRFSAVLLGTSLFAYISVREINSLHRLLKEQALTDQLTGLYNRSRLDDSLQQAIAQNRRSKVPMALISFDIDHFKSINDTLGHDTGDMVLKRLGDLLKRRTRRSDMIFRVGGEEFLILANNTDENQGAIFAEILRKNVEQGPLLTDRQVTISIGVCSLQEGMDAARWVKACDEKLYRAKAAGRNRVVV